MKKVLICLFTMLFFIPISVLAKEKTEDNLVKVYIFEAGGCPACEAQVEYLESLSSYKKKFTIVRRELYVDHIDWKRGEDYELGVNIVDAFINANYTNITVNSTPLVIVSDTYAKNGYNSGLETVIEKVYEEGDKDAVSCIEKGNSNCVREIDPEENETDNADTSKNNNDNGAGLLIFLVVIGIVILIIITSKKNSVKELEED